MDGKDDRAFNSMFQLPHIPRPRIAGEDLEDLGRDMGDVFMVLFGKSLEEMGRQERDILSSLPQRRKGDGYDIESVEEVLSEASVFHERFQELIRGGDHPHIHLDVSRFSHPFNLVFLEESQELRLHGEAEIAYLIEKDRPAVRLFEEPPFSRKRPGKGPPDMAEELTFYEGLRQRGTINRDEGPVISLAIIMDGASHRPSTWYPPP